MAKSKATPARTGRPGLAGLTESWRAADSAYQKHHFGCAVCAAAGAHPGMGTRCAEGERLWREYLHALEHYHRLPEIPVLPDPSAIMENKNPDWL